MAVLEKIRKRSILLFIIIIGALLAFILGDFLNSGRSLFGPGDTVAQVDNVKVKQMDLNKHSEQVENYVKQRRATGQQVQAELADPDYRYQQALDAALYEKLMNQECERLGIAVSDDFISKFVADPNTAGTVWQMLVSQLGGNPQEVSMALQQNGIVDPASYLDAIHNPARYRIDEQFASALTTAWQNMENDMAQQIQWTLYNQMLMAMMAPNKADAKAYFENQNSMANVQAVNIPLSSVSDDNVTIEDADYREVYDKTKEAFRILDENREVAFIVVNIQPSQQDYANADMAVQNLAADLNASEGVQALANHKGFSHQVLKLTDADLGRNFQFAVLRNDTLTEGKVIQLPSFSDTRSLVKITDVINGIDKVSFKYFPVESTEQADSLFADKSVEAIDKVIGDMTGNQLNNLTASLINPDPNGYGGMFAAMPAVAEALRVAPLNQYYLVDDTTTNAKGVLVVTERAEPVKAYEMSLMTYEVYPSEQTRQELNQQLHNYIANHPTAEQFVNDTTGTYNVVYTMVSPNQYTLYSPQMTPNTRALVKWAMDAKKGAVSPVFARQKTVYGRGDQPDETEDYLIALAVVDTYDNYVPATSHLVQQQLRGQVLNDKKAKTIIDQYNGKGNNLTEYASAMGVTPQTMNIAFGAGTIGGDAQGVLAAAKKGDLVGPVQGSNAVYVFQIDEVSTPDFAAADAKTRIEEAARSFRTPQLSPIMLIGNRKVDNNTIKYFTADPTAE